MSNNKVIVFASIVAAILPTGLLALNISMVGNAEALIPGEFVFCLEYPELCQVEEEVPGTTTCPVGTTLEGHLVAEGAPLDQVCDIDIVQLFTCPAGSNLGAGALVTDIDICYFD